MIKNGYYSLKKFNDKNNIAYYYCSDTACQAIGKCQYILEEDKKQKEIKEQNIE